MNKKIGLLSLGLLVGCVQGFSGLPKLNNQETIIWHYNCKDGTALNVEYAYMGDTYTATIQLSEEGKKVLEQVEPKVFVLEEYRWSSHDGRNFMLSDKDKVLRQQCVAMNAIASDAMTHYGGSF
ncbi:hypothetical protein [Suttonella ornithocola]|uniref:Membrane-bound lysozyme-inhibitor of c-type lysozyme n=1 Tax=Suttonella ornithocola TaxID=279832 RepID=A0A380MKA0_9GAMM|nr:hypothetical protein [Suttonella ornithocola]SUO93065.1 Uncharacterised protein [Suttonella ornithocola]